VEEDKIKIFYFLFFIFYLKKKGLVTNCLGGSIQIPQESYDAAAIIIALNLKTPCHQTSHRQIRSISREVVSHNLSACFHNL
jgi:hypothetical protein